MSTTSTPVSSSQRPALIIGGSGVVGAQAATLLRRLQPGLPLAIAGRDLAKAQQVARGLGHAEGWRVDLSRPDLGLPADAAFGAVVLFVKDEWQHALRFAQRRGIPFLSLSSGSFEIGPEVAQHLHAPQRSAVLLASHWLAGAALFPTLQLARSFQRLDKIRIGVLLDEQDMGGPAALADYERLTGVAPAALTLQDGRMRWISGAEAQTRYRSVDGVELPAQAYSPFDVMALAAATQARDIRLDLAYAESASRRRGEPFSTEIVLELEGLDAAGRPHSSRHQIVHPQGQAPLTALGVALGLERLLGLAGGAPVAPGLYLPEHLLDVDRFVAQMREFGARFEPA
ncbi:NAD(P)-dependent oxidoreductase [Roseateles sp. DAIF2]|uniref:NAD(P)-dependent oxidoreductase n=1 Tax=Roseateles sp. DAIF2 TaxID=2714952 RepID=UPI0018A2DF13|nr:NAD(P)-dependent oxidoreductase [Roseateles sp. DAIF2]QPF72970.1 NAD(P)-dependent oxidoreductase [Roseateles sp. DAIF2]